MKVQWKLLVATAALGAMFALAGCDGDDGAQGPPGERGPQGEQGEQGEQGPGLEPIDAAQGEICLTCHSGVGDEHQAVYAKYVDGSRLAMTFNDLTSVPDGAGGYDVTLKFSITKDGLPYVDTAGLPSMEQKRFYAVQYDSTTGEYLNGNTSLSANNVVPDVVLGDYVLTQTGLTFAPEAPAAPYDGSHVYGYVAQGALLEHAGAPGAELPAGSHVHLYDDVASAALAFGTAAVADVDAYESAANVSGCVKCHGEPYLKHGYRDPIVDGLPDFASCKSCHYDERPGGHEDWQYMVDDPENWATAGLPDLDVETKYAYKAKLMNDVHMAHAMEFPFPRSMANCVTCHEGKLDRVLANENFVIETCKSCHPVEGINAWPEAAGDTPKGLYAQDDRAPPLEYLWTKHNVESFHSEDADCLLCHGTSNIPAFNELHTGYDVRIADASGTKYRDLYLASIDDVDVSLVDNQMIISYSADESGIANAVPGSLQVSVYISFYGWDSKHFIVPSHNRDGTELCTSGGDPAGCRYEFTPGSSSPLFPNYEEVAPGSWELTVDLAAWTDGDAGSLGDLIADGVVRKAEITLASRLSLELVHDDEVEMIPANLTAVTQTVDLGAGAFVADYFKGKKATVKVASCEKCHDQLAVTWHTGFGLGGDDIVACKNCHNPTFAGSHFELASRSIENYVHALHSFQQEDIDEVFNEVVDNVEVPGYDAVRALRYDQHIKHTFPNFTIRNCEACHTPGTYNVPDQTASMPGVLSASADLKTFYDTIKSGGIPADIPTERVAGRKISGSIPEYVTGPASRACGGCHRADMINADNAAALESFNAHTGSFGTLVENDEEDVMLFDVIFKLMGM